MGLLANFVYGSIACIQYLSGIVVTMNKYRAYNCQSVKFMDTKFCLYLRKAKLYMGFHYNKITTDAWALEPNYSAKIR